MPKPYECTGSRSSSPDVKARARKNDSYIRGLYHRVGPAEFWRRRLCWLVENGRWVSYIRLVAYLRRKGLDGECGDIANPSIKMELAPFAYRAAASRVRTASGGVRSARKNGPL
jgi:hypothetical protein